MPDTEQNFTILFDEEQNFVEIKYQGVNALLLAQLEAEIAALEAEIDSVTAGYNGEIGVLQTQVAALIVQLNALTETLEEETATRLESDTSLGAAASAGDAELSDDIAATANAFAAGLLAEAAARNAAIEDATAIIITDVSALAISVSGLATDMGAAQASIIEVSEALSTETAARAAQYTALQADFDDTNAAVLEESVVRADADSAFAAQITVIEASIEAKTTTYYQSSPPSVGLVTGDLWFDTDDDNRAYRWSGSTWVDVTPASSGNTTYYQATAPASGMLPGDIWFDSDDNNLMYRWNGSTWAAVDDGRIAIVAASVTTEASARVSGDSALASSITTVQANVDTVAASVVTEGTVRAAGDGSISAKYSVKVDANGHVAGFGLIAQANNDYSHSSFIVNADEFSIWNGTTDVAPFTVSGGIVYMQNIIVQSADIENLTVDKLTVGATPYSPYTSFAWARGYYNGSATSILSQSNIASFTRNTQGIYDFVFTTAAPNADYIVQLNSNKSGDTTDGNICCIGTQSTSGFRVYFRGSGGSLRDPETVNIVVFTG